MNDNLSISTNAYLGSPIEKSLTGSREIVFSKAQVDQFIIDIATLHTNCSSIGDDLLEKAKKDLSKLVKKEVWASKNGKPYKTTVWVLAEEANKVNDVKDVEVKDSIADNISGLSIQKYSENSVLIQGDTYGNIDTLRDIKKEVGVGTYNKKLNGWIFPIRHISTILGRLIAKSSDKNSIYEEDEKIQEATELKNSIAINSPVKTPIGEGVITSSEYKGNSVSYAIRLKTGKQLIGMSKEDFTVLPSDDNTASQAINAANPMNRKQTQMSVSGDLSIKDKEILNAPLDKVDLIKSLQKKRDGFVKKLKNLSNSTPKKSTENKNTSKPRSGDRQSMSKKELNKLLEANGMMGVEEYYMNIFGTLPVTEEESKRRSDAMRGNQNAKKDGIKEEEKKLDKNKESKSDAKGSKSKKNEEESKLNLDDGSEQNYFNEETGKMNVDRKFEIKEIELKTSDGKIVKAKDMSAIKVKEMTVFNVKNVLDYDHPNYIPKVPEGYLRSRQMKYDSIKLENGDYLVDFSVPDRFTNFSEKEGDYVVLSKEQFAVMHAYNIDVAKAKEKLKADEANIRAKERWDALPQEVKDKYPGGYRKYGPKRVKILPNNRFLTSQGKLYKKFINSEASRNDIGKNIMAQNEDLNLAWNNFTVGQADYSGAYKKGKETSYAKKGSIDTLKDSHGINIKNQNGTDMVDSDIRDIENAMNDIFSVFGDRSSMASKWDLTVSHAGDKLQHASKARGLFIPAYKAIGSTMKQGPDQFGFTLAHEFAHFIDYSLAEKEGKSGRRFVSHDPSHIAGKIADTFRDNLNDPKLKTDKYFGNSHECFARALEQYFGQESKTEDEGFDLEKRRVKKSIFNEKVKPLIEQFFKEKDNLLKSISNEVIII